MTAGEHSIESAYNIIKLSSTFAAFIDYREFADFNLKIKFTLIFSMRRALMFTMLRNYKLA